MSGSFSLLHRFLDLRYGKICKLKLICRGWTIILNTSSIYNFFSLLYRTRNLFFSVLTTQIACSGIVFFSVKTWIDSFLFVLFSVDSIDIFSDDSENSIFLLVTDSCLLLCIFFSRWRARSFSSFYSALPIILYEFGRNIY